MIRQINLGINFNIINVSHSFYVDALYCNNVKYTLTTKSSLRFIKLVSNFKLLELRTARPALQRKQPHKNPLPQITLSYSSTYSRKIAYCCHGFRYVHNATSETSPTLRKQYDNGYCEFARDRSPGSAEFSYNDGLCGPFTHVLGG